MRPKLLLLICLISVLFCSASSSFDKSKDQSMVGPLSEVRKGKLKGYINGQGKLVTPLRKYMQNLGEGLIYIYGAPERDTILDLNTGKITSFKKIYNYVSKSYKGKILANHMRDHVAVVVDVEMNELLRLDRHNDGLRVIPWDGVDGHFIVASFTYGYGEPNKEKFGIVNLDDGVVIPYDYDSAGELGKNYWLTRKNGKVGVLNLKGEIIIPFKYERIFSKHDGIFKCMISMEENTSIILDSAGKEVKFPGNYDDIRFINSGKYLIAEKSGKDYLLDLKGNKALPKGYNEIIVPYGSHDIVCFKTGSNLCKCVNMGETIEWPETEKDLCCPYIIGDLNDAIFIKSTEEKCEYNPHFSYLYDGENLIPMDNIYSSMRESAGVIIAKNKKKRYIITKSLEIVADISEYDEVELFSF